MQRLHLVIPDLYWPDPRDDTPYEGLILPALSHLFSRGEVTAGKPVPLETWMAERFGWTRVDTDFPWCALARRALNLSLDGNAWCRADPVHLKSRRTALYLAQVDSRDLTADEADALCRSLNEHFLQDRIEFAAVKPTEWHVRLDRPVSIVTTPVAQAQGRNIDRLLPQGPDAALWTRRLNEAQMLLHEHPVNNARETHGVATINSIWPWGFGALPTLERPAFDHLVAAPAIFLGAGSVAGIAINDAANRFETSVFAGKGASLCVLEHTRLALARDNGEQWRDALTALDDQWLQPALDALKSGHLDQLELTALSQDNRLLIKLNRSDLWRFWRKRQSWVDFRSKPQS